MEKKNQKESLKKNSPRSGFYLVGAVIALLLLAISTTLLFVKTAVHGKVAPNTIISGVDVSLMSKSKAERVLTRATDTFEARPITFTLNNEIRTIAPEEMGISLFPDKTIETIKPVDAKDVGLFEWPGFFMKDRSIDVLNEINKEEMMFAVKDRFDLFAIEPMQAKFYFNKWKLDIMEGKKGWLLDEILLITQVKESISSFSGAQIALEIEEKEPSVNKVDLETHREKVVGMLNHQIELIDPVYSDNWYVKLVNHLDWVDFKLNNDFENTSSPIWVSINGDKLNEFVDEEISKWLDLSIEPVNIYLDEEKKVVIEGKGNDGMEIQRNVLKESMELAIHNETEKVQIPVKILEPEITISEELRAMGIKERIAVGHTSYYGSPPNRVYNIKAGASKFNGHLVAPDETFNFNATLGPVDGSTGYLKELVIKPEGTIPEFGGGICQVSTTVYRAILLGALPVAERNQHSYAVGYYAQVLGHGLDATIYIGGPNLKFTNDTGHHILMQTFTKGDYELYVIFYGTDTGREVELEGPYLSNYTSVGETIYQTTKALSPGAKKQVEKAHVGFKALWYRHITNPDGEVKTEPISTVYRAVPAKIMVGEGVVEE